MSDDQHLMQYIKNQWGATIAAACHSSSIPESFIAALVANESGGDPNAKRFEPGVLGHLAAVLVGEQANYGSIFPKQLLDYCLAGGYLADSNVLIEGVRVLRSLATSQGLIQIMGYEALPFYLPAPEDLATPSTEFTIGLKMLGQFAARFGLDVTKDFSELFDCWNTGRPHAPTADPKYIPNGLSRKAIYEALP